MDEKYTCKNMFFSHFPNILFVMDIKHVMKGIRNKISYSDKKESSILNKLKINNYILWGHWINTYKCDNENTAFQLHHTLKDDHLYLTSQLKNAQWISRRCFRWQHAKFNEKFPKILELSIPTHTKMGGIHIITYIKTYCNIHETVFFNCTMLM